jgi:hypothetical protein
MQYCKNLVNDSTPVLHYSVLYRCDLFIQILIYRHDVQLCFLLFLFKLSNSLLNISVSNEQPFVTQLLILLLLLLMFYTHCEKMNPFFKLMLVLLCTMVVSGNVFFGTLVNPISILVFLLLSFHWYSVVRSLLYLYYLSVEMRFRLPHTKSSSRT